eukprot:NODE_325_length_9674_cov_0.932846.p3 type:complete len:370 gc:universal NODE_325_length_9674_cov_0.932846:1862-753(-)
MKQVLRHDFLDNYYQSPVAYHEGAAVDVDSLKMDLQGICWRDLSKDRQRIRIDRENDYKDFTLKCYDKSSFHWNRFYNEEFYSYKCGVFTQPDFYHFQLRHCIANCGKHITVYLSRGNLCYLNWVTKESTTICPVNGYITTVSTFGNEILYGDFAGKVYLSSLQSNCNYSIKCSDSIINSVEMTRDNLIIGCNDKFCNIFDRKSNEKTTSIHAESAVNCARFNSELNLLGMALDSPTVAIMDLRSDSLYTKLSGPQDDGFSLSWHGCYIAGAFQDETVRVWDLRNSQQELFCLKSKIGAFRNVQFTRSGYLVGAETDDYIHFYDLKTNTTCSYDFFGAVCGVGCDGDDVFFGIKEYNHSGIFHFELSDP